MTRKEFLKKLTALVGEYGASNGNMVVSVAIDGDILVWDGKKMDLMASLGRPTKKKDTPIGGISRRTHGPGEIRQIGVGVTFPSEVPGFDTDPDWDHYAHCWGDSPEAKLRRSVNDGVCSRCWEAHKREEQRLADEGSRAALNRDRSKDPY